MSEIARPAVTEQEIPIYAFDHLTGPVPELADIWPRLNRLLEHRRNFNRDEAAIRAQQHGIIRDTQFLMPSPFADTADACDSSYLVQQRFFYHFPRAEEYFWITARLDQAMRWP
jgi:hypothetical protein